MRAGCEGSDGAGGLMKQLMCMIPNARYGVGGEEGDVFALCWLGVLVIFSLLLVIPISKCFVGFVAGTVDRRENCHLKRTFGRDGHHAAAMYQAYLQRI